MTITRPSTDLPQAEAALSGHVNDTDEVESRLASVVDVEGPARQRVLDDVVVRHLGLATAIARRYAGRGIELDDLVQVARLALCKAAAGYRPGRGATFVGYAAPTISGELKRHFRDTGWTVRPPRRLQELRARVGAAEEALRHSAQGEPTERALAEAIDVTVSEVREARVCDGGYHAVSLEALDARAGLPTTGQWDGGYAHLEEGLTLRTALATLPDGELSLLQLRFVEERTQADIGHVLGVSQMQVSRLLSGVLSRLRAAIEGPCVTT